MDGEGAPPGLDDRGAPNRNVPTSRSATGSNPSVPRTSTGTLSVVPSPHATVAVWVSLPGSVTLPLFVAVSPSVTVTDPLSTVSEGGSLPS